ncbi:MAG: S8 family serine peptidase [Arenicella sp.]|nr:S8 family serine peptidase [Arenicella sp.]HAU68816.1 hypothetical protein [Gammaproteobacteria bacterium]
MIKTSGLDAEFQTSLSLNMDLKSHISGRFRSSKIKSKLSTAVLTACSLMLSVPNASAQQIALLDTGVDPDAGLNIAGGFNYFLNDPDTSDVSPREGEGHGTVSARVASEAFSGEIVPFVITDGLADGNSESQSTLARDSALSDILGNNSIRVVGLSWGTPGVTGTTASLMPSLSNANKVVAIVAGNDGANQPNALATTSFNLPGVIIVGGTDYNGDLLFFSNRAGTTQDKFVAAIGIPEPDGGDGGTSWATARIAGIAGAVLLQNPNLTGQEVVDVILSSAEDRGDPGTDAVYGRGVILSASQVLDNVIGPITVPTVPDENGSGGSSGGGGGGAGLLLGGALVGALLLARKPSKRLEKTLVLDSYGRTFQLDIGDHVAIDDETLDLDTFFNSLEQTSVNQSIYLPGLRTEIGVSALGRATPRTDMIAYFAMPDDKVINDGQMQYAFALSSQLSQTVNLSMGHRVDPNLYFGGLRDLNDSADFGRASFLTGQSFGSLLSGFSNQANSVGLNYRSKQPSGFNASMGLVSVDESERYGKQSFSSILEGGYEFADNGGLKVQFGQLQERGSLFGGAAGGIFGVEQATTYAINLNGHIKFSAHTALVANYGIGRTRVEATRTSLLSDFSSLSSDWYSVGLVTNKVWSHSDQFGISVSQPLKVQSGSLNYSIPVQRDQFGDIAFDTERVNLGEADSSEQRFEMYYRNKVDQKLELGAFLTFRDDPNHTTAADDELTVMFTLKYQP